MRIIVIGAGKVGFTIAEHLIAEEHDVIIIDKSEEVVERYGEDGATSETYKTELLNGIIMSKEIISKDTYNPLSKVIRRNK